VRPRGLPLTAPLLLVLLLLLLQIQRRLDGLWQLRLVGVSARVGHGRCLQARTQALVLLLKLLNLGLHLVFLAVQLGVSSIEVVALVLERSELPFQSLDLLFWNYQLKVWPSNMVRRTASLSECCLGCAVLSPTAL
jgi:hypothetical protein